MKSIVNRIQPIHVNLIAASIFIFLAFAITLIPNSNAAAGSFTVTKTEDTNDGTCDTDCSLREAIAATNSVGGADEITLPAGTYNLTLGTDLLITDDLTLTGASPETTIIHATGTNGQRVFKITNQTVVLENITIENGNCKNACSNLNVAGGGIYAAAGSDLTLDNVRVQDNTAGYGAGIYTEGDLTVIHGSSFSNNGASSYGSGAIHLQSSTSLTIENATFSGNSGGGSGAIYSSAGTTSITSTTFTSNSADTYGGALHTSGSAVTIIGCTFDGNQVLDGYGGGALMILNNSLTISDSSFTNNSSNHHDRSGGGALYTSASGADMTVGISDTIFQGNAVTSQDSGTGGAIRMITNPGDSMDVTLTDVTVADNTINALTATGAGIYFMGRSDGPLTSTLTRVTISGNAGTATATGFGATRGGGFYSTDASNSFDLVTVSGNSMSDAYGGQAGGVSFEDGTHTILNSLITGNASANGALLSYATTSIGNSIIANNSTKNCTVTGGFTSLGYNIESKTGCGFTATGDQQSTDPLVEELADNGGTTKTHALSIDSPAIDAGSCPSATSDQRGMTRPIDFSAIANVDDGCDIGPFELAHTIFLPLVIR